MWKITLRRGIVLMMKIMFEGVWTCLKQLAPKAIVIELVTHRSNMHFPDFDYFKWERENKYFALIWNPRRTGNGDPLLYIALALKPSWKVTFDLRRIDRFVRCDNRIRSSEIINSLNISSLTLRFLPRHGTRNDGRKRFSCTFARLRYRNMHVCVCFCEQDCKPNEDIRQ